MKHVKIFEAYTELNHLNTVDGELNEFKKSISAGDYIKTHKWYGNSNMNTEVNKFKIIDVVYTKNPNSEWKNFISYVVEDIFGQQYTIKNSDIDKQISKTNFNQVQQMNPEFDTNDYDDFDYDDEGNRIVDENKNIDITANIKTNNIKDVETFFNDIKQSAKRITDDEDDDTPNNKTGRSYDEDNEEDDLIVQGEAKIVNENIKTFDTFDHINEFGGDQNYNEINELKERVEKLENQFLYLETLIEVGDRNR